MYAGLAEKLKTQAASELRFDELGEEEDEVEEKDEHEELGNDQQFGEGDKWISEEILRDNINADVTEKSLQETMTLNRANVMQLRHFSHENVSGDASELELLKPHHTNDLNGSVHSQQGCSKDGGAISGRSIIDFNDSTATSGLSGTACNKDRWLANQRVTDGDRGRAVR